MCSSIIYNSSATIGLVLVLYIKYMYVKDAVSTEGRCPCGFGRLVWLGKTPLLLRGWTELTLEKTARDSPGVLFF